MMLLLTSVLACMRAWQVRGRLQMRKQLARASACLEACRLLHQVQQFLRFQKSDGIQELVS